MAEQERTPRQERVWRHAGWLLGLLSAVVVFTARADAPRLDVSGARVELGSAATRVEDEAGRLTVSDLLRKVGEERPGAILNSIGFEKRVHWFRVELENPTGAPLRRLLVAEPAWLDEVDAVLAAPDGSLIEQHGGNHLPFAARAVANPRINLPLVLPPGKSTLLVRIRSCGPTAVELNLWEREAFLRASDARSVYEGIGFGVVAAILLLNLILRLMLREPIFGAFVTYLGAFLMLHVVYDGFAYQYLWPDQPAWNSWINSAMVYLMVAAGVRFAMVFLELKARFRRLHRWSAALIAAICASLLVGTVHDGLQSDYFWFVWATVGPVFTLALVLAVLRDGHRAARYYLGAMVSILLGSLITALTVAGYIPFSVYAYEAVEIGMFAGMLLLAIAVAERMVTAFGAAEAARAEALASTRAHAERLAAEVEQRTAELQATTAAKDKFFSIIAHDLRGPIRSLAMLYTDVVTAPEQFSGEVLSLTRTTTIEVSHLLEHLLLWARTQRGEIDYRPEWLDLSELLREIEGLDLADATAKGVALQLVPDVPCPVFADRQMARTILRNLIGNALKFTPPGGRVKASVARQGPWRAIRITDTGIGIGVKRQRSLFTLDASRGDDLRPRHGSGLGLLLCREFVERHGGTIAVESRPGAGAAFTFTLPVIAPAG